MYLKYLCAVSTVYRTVFEDNQLSLKTAYKPSTIAKTSSESVNQQKKLIQGQLSINIVLTKLQNTSRLFVTLWCSGQIPLRMVD